MHAATIFAPLVAPVVALAVFGKSRFLAAHARKSLAETLLLQGALLVVGIVSLGFTLSSLYAHYQNEWRDFSVWPFVAKAIVGWVLLAVLEAVNAAISVRQACWAYQGNWPRTSRMLAKK